MIKKIGIWLLIGALVACGTVSNESENSGESSLSFEKRSEGSYIPDAVINNLAGKRRSKLSSLYSDGASWFSFRIKEPFKNLRIGLKGQQSSYVMDWSTQVDEQSEDVLPLRNVNQGDFMVDVVLNPGEVTVFFNEGLESFSFKTETQTIDAKVEVYLDGELRDLPGVLYDIGV